MASSSTLKLVIEKGPRQGETLEFNPRSTVRLGRVVKGNNLTIKDVAISTNHLKIVFNRNSKTWEITDLESSNGTFLNSSLLTPLSPFPISNGDEIKIGEITSVRVEITEQEIKNRRTTRNQAATASNLGKKVEECLNLGENNSRVRVSNEENNRKGRGPKKVVILDDEQNDENVENVKAKEKPISTRNTRSSKRGEVEFIGEVEVRQTRRTRSAKNVMTDTEGEGLDMVEENKGRTRGGRGRGRKKKEETGNDEVSEKEARILDDKMNEGSEQEQHCAELMGETAVPNDIDAMLDDGRKEEKEVFIPKEVINHGGDTKQVEIGNKRTIGGRGRGRKKKEETGNDEVSEKEVCVLDDMMNEGTDQEQHCAELMGETAVPNEIDAMLDDGRKEEKELVRDAIPKEVSNHEGDSKQVEIENKRTMGGRGRGCGRKKREQVDAFQEETRDHEVSDRKLHVLDDKTNEGNGQEQDCAELMGATAVPDGVETDAVVDDGRKQETGLVRDVIPIEMINHQVLEKGACEIVMDDDAQKNALHEKATAQFLEGEDPEQEGGDQRCVEPVEEVAQLEDDSLVDASHVEERVCDEMLDDERRVEEDFEEESEAECSSRSEDPVPDLNTLTLGEWFDYMELYLPKLIRAKTDAVIEDLIKRTKQVEEYKSLQQKGIRELP